MKGNVHPSFLNCNNCNCNAPHSSSTRPIIPLFHKKVYPFVSPFTNNSYLCTFIMETSKTTIESQIATVLSEIRQKGFSSIQPFAIGKLEKRMMQFAQANAITLASDELYMSAKQLQHCMRASKATKGLVVSDTDLISFPQNRFHMDLYYDGECFIYTDGQSKFCASSKSRPAGIRRQRPSSTA